MSQRPSEAHATRVLSALNRYEKKPLALIDGFTYLKAVTSGKQKRGIYILAGDLTREVFRSCLVEAQSAGVDSNRLYIYGRLGIYSGRSIEFTRLEDLGL